MKVEIITLHKITNFGSMLQTYATQTAIEKLGCEAEILDFVPEGMTFRRACWPRNSAPAWKKIIKFLPLLVCNIVQFGIMRSFMSRYINLSSKRYTCYNDIIENVPQADAFLSGSDQVWNTQNNNPKDDLLAYYLGFVPDGKLRIAYAGSFGKNNFTYEESAVIKEYLPKYDFLSVREDVGLMIMEHHGISNGVHVVDPTLLLDADEWIHFANQTPPKYKYIFVYNLNRNSLIKQLAKEISKQRNLRIVNFADSFDFIPGAKNRLCNTAIDFINYIANAEIVLTDSFHGIAFSINFQKQFISTKAPRYNSRLESILRMTGLIDTRMVSSFEEGMKVSKESIDYTNVMSIVNDERIKSLDFLKYALSR